jgi:O-succinylbenzoic acid--CoA ligase
MKSLDEFIWLGRFDNVINSGGVKVFPESTERKIEAIFSELKIVNRFFIAGLPDEKWGQTVALIVEGSLTEKTIEKMQGKIKERLSKFEIPHSIKFLERFAETGTGKINRKETISKL